MTTDEMMSKFAELPLMWRVGAAGDAILREPGMSVEHRGALLAMAIWPAPAAATDSR